MDTPIFISVLIYFPADAGNNIPPPTLTSMQISASDAAARFGIGIVMWEGRRQGGDCIAFCYASGRRDLSYYILHQGCNKKLAADERG